MTTYASDKPRILIVDESYIGCLLNDLIFSEHGFIVVTSNDGEEAVALAHDRSPDVVLLSLSLSNGLDAGEVIRRIRLGDTTRDARIIVIDGPAPLAELNELARLGHAFVAGADTFVAKSCLPDKLLEIVRRALADRDAIVRARFLATHRSEDHETNAPDDPPRVDLEWGHEHAAIAAV